MQRYKTATEMRIALDAALLAPVLQGRMRRRIAAAALASANDARRDVRLKSSHDPACAPAAFDLRREDRAVATAKAPAPQRPRRMVDRGR